MELRENLNSRTKGGVRNLSLPPRRSADLIRLMNQFNLKDFKCCGCDNTWRAMSHSNQEWCSIDCQMVNGDQKRTPCGKPRSSRRGRKKGLAVTHNGKRQYLADWAREMNIDYHRLYARYKRTGKL